MIMWWANSVNCVGEAVSAGLQAATGRRSKHDFCLFTREDLHLLSVSLLSSSRCPPVFTFSSLERIYDTSSVSIALTPDITSCLCAGLLWSNITECDRRNEDGGQRHFTNGETLQPHLLVSHCNKQQRNQLFIVSKRGLVCWLTSAVWVGVIIQ